MNFHKHLDSCEQCRNNPFSLCDTGVNLLNDEIGQTRLFLNELDKPKQSYWYWCSKCKTKILLYSPDETSHVIFWKNGTTWFTSEHHRIMRIIESNRIESK